jgi:hypothetical protein
MKTGKSTSLDSSIKPCSESGLQAQIILKVCQMFPDSLTIWRNNTGAIHDGTRLVRFGIPGQADISGILKPLGCRIEIEVKRPDRKGRQSEAQKNFQTMITNHGGLYLLCDGDIEEQIIEPVRERLERDGRVVR